MQTTQSRLLKYNENFDFCKIGCVGDLLTILSLRAKVITRLIVKF